MLEDRRDSTPEMIEHAALKLARIADDLALNHQERAKFVELFLPFAEHLDLLISQGRTDEAKKLIEGKIDISAEM